MPDYLSFAPDFSAPAIVAAYDEVPLWSAMFGLLLLEEVPLENVRMALDVGCGTGFPLIELAERLGPGTRVHGIDPWSAGLKRAAEKISCRSTSNATLHEGSASALPFPDATFDLIVSNLGLNNFDDRVEALRECRRVARPHATLAITTNLQGHMAELYSTFEQLLREDEDEDALQRLTEHVRHRATIEGVRELMKNTGFSVSRVVERRASMRFADGTALLNHHFIKLGFLDAWKAIVAGREHTFFPRLQKRLDQMGELSLTIPMAYIEANVGSAAG